MGKQINIPIEDARWVMRPGDLLLFRAGLKPYRLLISRLGRTEYCHAAMIDGSPVPWLTDFEIVEMLDFRGGMVSNLRDSVDQWPGLWDLYRADPDNRWPHFDRDLAVQAMRDIVGQQYGWCNLARVALLHLPFVRLLIPADTDDSTKSLWPLFCSQAIARACRAGGVDPVPQLADRLTEPGDLARSLFFRYECTLIPKRKP